MMSFMGSISREIMSGWQLPLGSVGITKKLVRLGLNDTFAHGASRPYLMKEYGLDALALVRAVEDMLSVQLAVSAEDLDAVRIEPVHSAARPEAL